MLNTNDRLIGIVDQMPPPNARVNFITDTCSLQTITFDAKKYRAQLMVLPTNANETQFAICNSAYDVTITGVSIFWVTAYTIDTNGNMHIEGYKDCNCNSIALNSGWPTLGSNNTLYHYNQTFGGVSAEAHKTGAPVPSDAIAVLLAYYNWYDTTITANTVLTDKVYNDVTDSTTAFITDRAFVESMIWLQTEATFDISASNIIYPWTTNRTIVCGSKDSLLAL